VLKFFIKFLDADFLGIAKKSLLKLDHAKIFTGVSGGYFRTGRNEIVT
jgi:hypothetical protein